MDTTYITNATSPAPRQPCYAVFDATEHLEDAVKRLDSVADDLTNNLVRLIGPWPSAVQDTAGDLVPEAQVERLSRVVGHIHGRIERLFDLVARLERI